MRVAVVLMLLALAGCNEGTSTMSPTAQVQSGFLPGGIANQIEIRAVERLPLRSAELIAPDGKATPALSITANPVATDTYWQQFPNRSSGTNPGATGIGSNVAPGVVGAAPMTQTRLLAVSSTASIRLPDPVAYQGDWEKYRIRLRFGDPPEVETREIAAPAPLPSP